MVDATGIEPVTPTMSTWCSTAELRVRTAVNVITWIARELPRFKPVSGKNPQSKLQGGRQ